jgi:tripartite-type tricarboxylate transporter receptor subunit TctC
MRASTNAEMVLIRCKGVAPTIVDVLAGRTHFTFAAPAPTLAHIQDGKLRPLAILLARAAGMKPE